MAGTGAAGMALSKSFKDVMESPEYDKLSDEGKLFLLYKLYESEVNEKPNKTELLPVVQGANHTGGSEIVVQGPTITSLPMTEKEAIDYILTTPRSDEMNSSTVSVGEDSSVLGLRAVYSEQDSSSNSVRLNKQLLGEEVSQGHAFDRHVLGNANGVNEFAEFGVKTKDDFAKFIEKVSSNPTEVRTYSNGRIAIIDEKTKTVIIKNSTTGESTAFRPEFDVGWDRYLKQLPKQQIPFDVVK